jgi:hypothetical protein
MPISAEDLLHGRTPADLPASAPDRDWLQSGDFLREAQLTDVGFAALSSRLCLVFDLRNALGFPDADVAVVALDRVREFSWLGSGTAQRYRPWLVMNSGFSQSDGWHRVVLGLMSSQDFSAVCGSVEFFAGRSDFYDLAPADLSEDSAEEIEAGFPRVGTGFVVGDYFRLD